MSFAVFMNMLTLTFRFQAAIWKKQLQNCRVKDMQSQQQSILKTLTQAISSHFLFLDAPATDSPVKLKRASDVSAPETDGSPLRVFGSLPGSTAPGTVKSEVKRWNPSKNKKRKQVLQTQLQTMHDSVNSVGSKVFGPSSLA